VITTNRTMSDFKMNAEKYFKVFFRDLKKKVTQQVTLMEQ